MPQTCHAGPSKRATLLTTASALVLLAAAMLTLHRVPPARAYDQYSTDRTSGNCANCHGDFRAASYVSKNDAVAWGTSLHDGHRQTMLSGDCNVCHGAARFPVAMDASDGGTGFAPIGCAGCHGRAEPAAGGQVTGAGLRQHHYRSGVTVCANAGCHADANPAAFTPVPETTSPPYYFTPDDAHPNKPVQACNGDDSESPVAAPLGLDNDGDLAYDGADTDCTVGVEDAGAPPGGLVLRGAEPNPARQGVRVAFILASERPATLELLDVGGRRLALRDVGGLGPGPHAIELQAGRPLAPGVYLLRLIQGGVIRIAKAIVTN